MSLKVKLGIASALSLAMVAGILFFLLNERHPSNQDEEAGPAPDVVAAPAAAPVKKAARPATARPAAKPAARSDEAPVGAAPQTGGWLITGRIVREGPPVDGGAPDPAATVPAEGVSVTLKSHPRRTKPGEAIPPATRITAADGLFEFAHVPGDRYMRMEIDEPSSALRTISFQLGDPPANDKKELGDIPIEPANTLVVKLEGPDGEEVKKGYVLVGRRFANRTSLQEQGFNESRREAEEQPGGKYVLRRAPPGSFNVAARAPGYALKSSPCELPQKEPLVLRLEKGLSISGLVLAADRNPIEGAELEVSGPNLGDPPPKTKSDGSGRFYFDTLSAGEYNVKVEATGYAAARKDDVPTGTEDLEFLLPPEAVVSGKVIADEDERPIEKARVTIRSADRRSSFQKESNAKGAFEIRKLPAGSLLIIAEHEEFAATVEAPLEVEEGGRITDQVIRMKKGIQAAGKVVESGTSTGIPDAQVVFQPQFPGGRSKNSRSGPEGVFEMKGLSEGRYFISANAKGFTPIQQKSVTIAAGGTPDLTIELERGASISGRVLSLTGEPIAGATVRPNFSSNLNYGWDEKVNSIFNISAQSDAEGRYRLEGLVAHAGYMVIASHRDYATAKVSGISLKQKDSVEDIDIALARGGAVRGRVTDPDGKGIAGASISASLMVVEGGEAERPMVNFGDQGGSATTDSEGRYSLPHLAAGTHTIVAQARNRASSRKNDLKVAEGRSVEGLDFVLGDGEQLSGKVVDADGNPVAAATVYIYGEDQNSSPITSDSEGHFEARGFRAGQVTVQASKSGFIGESTRVSVPALEAVITLKRAGKISGMVRAKGRDTFPAFTIMASRKQGNGMSTSMSQYNDITGRFDITVGEGTYTLQANVPGFAPSDSAEIVIKTGEQVDGVVIDLLPGGTIHGVVVALRTGEPIEGASVNFITGQRSWYGNQSNATTDADGAFTLEGVPSGSIDLTATHGQFAQAFARGISVRVGQTSETRIEMGAGGGIRGTVTYAGKPQAGASVYAMKKNPGPMENIAKNATTDAEGRYEISGLPEGDYMVNANRGGQFNGTSSMHRDATVLEGQVAEVDLGQEAGIRVSGRVISNGEAVRVRRIEAMQPERSWNGRSTDLDDSGNYSIEVPGPGVYHFMVGDEGRGGAKLMVEVPEGVTELNRDLILPSGEITGVVVDAAGGGAVAQAQVIAFSSGTVFRSVMNLFRSMQGMGQTDNQGRFSIPRVGGGSYSLLVMAEGFASGRLDGVEVQEGRRSRDLQVALERGIDFQVRVTDQRGNPVSGAMAFLRDQDGNFVIFNRPWTSGPDGVVLFQGLLPGNYKLSTVHPQFAPARASLRAAAGVALSTVVLRPGGKVSVQVVGAKGQPVEGAEVEVIDENGESVADDLSLAAMRSQMAMATAKNGIMAFDQLAPGTYRITALKGKLRSKEEKIAVTEGRTSETTVALE